MLSCGSSPCTDGGNSRSGSTRGDAGFAGAVGALSRPRDPAFYDDAIRARALGAHQNGIEAFPFFAAAVLLAEFRGAPQNLINELAILFVIVRVAYVLTYIGNRPRLRSILWNVGFTINAAIFFLPLIRKLWLA